MPVLLLSTWSLPASRSLAEAARHVGWSVHASDDVPAVLPSGRVVYYGGTDLAGEIAARFRLVGRDSTGCVVPQGAPESAALLERLQRLPGFDNEALIRAMTSTGDTRFACWRRPS